MTLDWLIVGGGIHGVHAAVRLLAEAGVAPERLRIVDPSDHLLDRWRAHTARTGMTHLRSPAVHHLDLDPWSLHRFAGSRRHRKPGVFAPPYERPSLALFNAHCDHVVGEYGLEAAHIRARATSCSVHEDRVLVRLGDGGELVSRQLILALGAGEQPNWPDWAPRGHGRVQHIFGARHHPSHQPAERVAVIGGGISAAQVALRLDDEGHAVQVVSRHALRQHQFDSDPGWLGPKHMASFSREPRHERRRELVDRARNRGSLPPDVWRAFSRAINQGRITLHQADVLAASAEPDVVNLTLSSGARLEVDRLVLATGLAPGRPGGEMIDRLVAQAELPCASCGYPIVDSALRWHPRVLVMGPLAELELGPIARNIAGARRAGDRIVAAAGARGAGMVLSPQVAAVASAGAL